MRNIFFLFLMAAAIRCGAQNPSTQIVEWPGVTVFEVNSGQQHDQEYTLKTSPDAAQLIEANGSVSRVFQVVETTGSWNNVNQAGSITFQGTCGGVSAAITIERTGSVVTGRIFINEEQPIIYELTLGQSHGTID